MKTTFVILALSSTFIITSCNNEPVQTAGPETNSSYDQSTISDSSIHANPSVNNANSDPQNTSDQMVPENTGPKTTTVK